MKLTGEHIQDLALLRWFSNEKNADEPLSEIGVRVARDLKSKGLVRFVSHSDGNYVEVTDAGRAVLQHESSPDDT